MKKALLLTVILGFCSMYALAADQSWSGWISDTKCGVNGANASHAACAKKCVGSGEKPVLVTDKDQKVVNISNPQAVANNVGDHVKVSGKMAADGSLHVDKVSKSGS